MLASSETPKPKPQGVNGNKTRHDKTRQDTTRQDKTRQDKTRCSRMSELSIKDEGAISDLGDGSSHSRWHSVRWHLHRTRVQVLLNQQHSLLEQPIRLLRHLPRVSHQHVQHCVVCVRRQDGTV